MGNTEATIFQGLDEKFYVLEWFPFMQLWALYELGEPVYTEVAYSW